MATRIPTKRLQYRVDYFPNVLKKNSFRSLNMAILTGGKIACTDIGKLLGQGHSHFILWTIASQNYRPLLVFLKNLLIEKRYAFLSFSSFLNSEATEIVLEHSIQLVIYAAFYRFIYQLLFYNSSQLSYCYTN